MSLAQQHPNINIFALCGGSTSSLSSSLLQSLENRWHLKPLSYKEREEMIAKAGLHQQQYGSFLVEATTGFYDSEMQTLLQSAQQVGPQMGVRGFYAKHKPHLENYADSLPLFSQSSLDCLEPVWSNKMSCTGRIMLEIGSGNSKYRVEIKAVSKELPLPDVTIFHSAKLHPMLFRFAYYRQLDQFKLFSYQWWRQEELNNCQMHERLIDTMNEDINLYSKVCFVVDCDDLLLCCKPDEEVYLLKTLALVSKRAMVAANKEVWMFFICSNENFAKQLRKESYWKLTAQERSLLDNQ